ncbi:MAG: tetratricopeptide repeat protein [Pseudomonadota bacterium]
MINTTIKTLAVVFFLGACTVDDGGLQSGLAAIHKGSYVEAESHFESMLAEDPGDPYVLLNLGVAKARLGKTGEAEQLYRKAILTGGDAPVRSVVVKQGGQDVESTVAAIAAQNLADLGN